MGTIKKRPTPNGPIGWVTIGGERLPVIADPLWYRQWTEQIDGGAEVLAQSIVSDVIKPGATTDVVSASSASFSLVSESHTPDGEIWRDSVISVAYTATAACSVNLLLSCIYEINGTTGANIYIQGGINEVGAWAGSNDSVSIAHVLASPDYDTKGHISTSKGFTMAAGESKTFAFMAKRVSFNSETITLSNISLRLEAIKV